MPSMGFYTSLKYTASNKIMIISMWRFSLICLPKKLVIKFENHPGNLPVRNNSGRGVMAILASRIYFGNGYSRLIPAIKPIPPPPPINALPGRFKISKLTPDVVHVKRGGHAIMQPISACSLKSQVAMHGNRRWGIHLQDSRAKLFRRVFVIICGGNNTQGGSPRAHFFLTFRQDLQD